MQILLLYFKLKSTSDFGMNLQTEGIAYQFNVSLPLLSLRDHQRILVLMY